MQNDLGVDIGFGFTKTCSTAGVKIFPTAIIPAAAKSEFSEVKPVLIDDRKFIIGNDALTDGRSLISTRTSDFVTSDAWMAVLGYAIATNSTPEGLIDGKLVLGVPPGEYSRQYAGTIIDKVKRSIIRHGDQLYPLNRTKIVVIPQGAGIYYACAENDHKLFKQNVVIVDIGHYTIDMVLFAEGIYKEGAVATYHIGLSKLLDAIKGAFHRQHRTSISHRDANILLKEKSLTIVGTPYHLYGLENIVDSYLEEVRSAIDEYFSTLSCRPEKGIVGGGGVLALKGLIKPKYQLIIAPDPEYANARGYLNYANKIGG